MICLGCSEHQNNVFIIQDATMHWFNVFTMDLKAFEVTWILHRIEGVQSFFDACIFERNETFHC